MCVCSCEFCWCVVYMRVCACVCVCRVRSVRCGVAHVVRCGMVCLNHERVGLVTTKNPVPDPHIAMMHG